MQMQEKRFRFEKLEVWQAARRFNITIHDISRRFPDEERFMLTAQIRRASVSVSSNIAEGCGRNSDRDFAHFLEQSYGSLMEVASQLFLAADLKYLASEDFASALDDAQSISAQLAALNRSLGVQHTKVHPPA